MKKIRFSLLLICSVAIFLGCTTSDFPESDTLPISVQTSDEKDSENETQTEAEPDTESVPAEQVTTKTDEIFSETHPEMVSEPPMCVSINTIDDLSKMYDAIEYSESDLSEYLDANHFTMNGVSTREQLIYWTNKLDTIPIYSFPDTSSLHFLIYPEFDRIDVWYDGTESRICISSYYFSNTNVDKLSANVKNEVYSDFSITNTEVAHLTMCDKTEIYTAYCYIGKNYSEVCKIYRDTPESALQTLNQIVDTNHVSNLFLEHKGEQQ